MISPPANAKSRKTSHTELRTQQKLIMGDETAIEVAT
jgi:hypothetical protein